jgi:hypothetical protein
MQRVDLGAWKFVKQAVVHHRFGTGLPFFRGLEDHVDAAVETPCCSEITSGPKQHRRVAIMTTTVRDTLMNACVWGARAFVDRQSIHVGAQSDGTIGASGTDHSYDTGFAYPLVYGDAPGTQSLGDQCGRPLLFEPQLRVAMDIASDGAHLVGPRPHRSKHHRTIHRTELRGRAPPARSAI